MNNHWKRWIFVVSAALLLSIAGVAILLTTFRTTSAHVLHITSLGVHNTTMSNWPELESVEIRQAEGKLIMVVKESIVTDGQGSWWNPWKHHSGTTYVKELPLQEPWEITVCDKDRTVTFKSDSYRFVYDCSGPHGSISYGGELKTPGY